MDTAKDKRLKKDKEKESAGYSENGFIRYWQMLWEKRWRLIRTNLLYVAFTILFLAIILALFYYLSAMVFSLSGVSVGDVFVDDSYSGVFLRIIILCGLYFTCIPVFAIGPVRAGYEYLIKSYVKGEPTFLWTDFSTKIRSNRKLGLQAGLINGLAGFLLLLDAVVYLAVSNNPTGFFANIPGFLLFIMAVMVAFGFAILLMMNLYIYPMMVIFNISLKQLYKNAFIFAMIRWLPNLGILLLDFAMLALPILLIPGNTGFYVALLLYILILPTWIAFTNTYYVYPTIKKFMIDNPAADKSGGAGSGQRGEFPEFTPPPGMLRYQNGRYLSDEEYEEFLKHAEIQDIGAGNADSAVHADNTDNPDNADNT